MSQNNQPQSFPEDLLWSVKLYTFKIAEAIDKTGEELGSQLGDALSKASWLPEAIRPNQRTAQSTSILGKLPPKPKGFYDRLSQWTYDHKWTVALVAVGAVCAGGYVYRKKTRVVRRRAKLAANGGRKEVVILAGSPHDPLTKSLALGLERRGCIVFVVVNSMDDEMVVLNLGQRDIKPLHLDLLDAKGSQAAMDRFQTLMSLPTQAFNGAQPHRLTLMGVVLIPDSQYPTGPVETLNPENWSDVLNLRLLAPFVTSKLFIPLLREHRSRMLVLTPAIVPALTPPFHAPEAVAGAALEAFTFSLRRELRPLSVPVSQIRVGALDWQGANKRLFLQGANAPRADIFSWPTSARGAYAQTYSSQAERLTNGVKGSSMREVTNVVFNTLVASRPRKVVRVGSGSLVYEILGKLAPDGLISWMLSGKASACVEADAMSSGGSSTEGSVDWEKVEKSA